VLYSNIRYCVVTVLPLADERSRRSQNVVVKRLKP